MKKRSLGDTENNDKRFSLKEWLGLSIFGTITFGGAFLIGRKMIKEGRSEKEQDKAFEEGTAADYATQVKLALHNDGWLGADTAKLRSVLVEIPSQEDFDKVVKSYEKINGGSMLADMKSELKTTEYDEMENIISAKPKKANDKVDMSVKYPAWANRLNSALQKTWGWFSDADKDAVKAVFYEIPTQTDYVNTGTAYLSIYHSSLDDDLKSKLSSGDLSEVTAIINSKPIA